MIATMTGESWNSINFQFFWLECAGLTLDDGCNCPWPLWPRRALEQRAGRAAWEDSNMFNSEALSVTGAGRRRYTTPVMIAAVWLALAGGGSNAAAGECEPAWHPFESGGEVGVNDTAAELTVWNGDLVPDQA